MMGLRTSETGRRGFTAPPAILEGASLEAAAQFLLAAAVVAALVADFVRQRAAVDVVGNVLQRGGGDVGERLAGEKALMRGQQHVGERNQPRQHIVIHHLRGEILEKVLAFFLVHIQAGRPHVLVAQSVHQRF